MRDVAEAAGLSTGNVYHQFPDKETIFNTLLDQYWAAIADPAFPFNRALDEGAFPDDLEALGRAARESVRLYRDHVALIYVDVVEFDGRHIRKFYSEMARRFAAYIERHRGRVEGRLRPGVSPLSAVMLASRFLLYYFSVELVFGVPNHFGKPTDDVLKDVADIFGHGMLALPGAPPDRPGAGAAGAPPEPGLHTP
jgi:AcrR family transcriptional regulator